MLKLKEKLPQTRFIGVGGKYMQQAGLSTFVRMERLSIIGITEALRRSIALLRINHGLKKFLRVSQPDLFIGIDAPGLNLHLAGYMRALGCPTVQYVSPTFWAWGEHRIHKVKKATDLVLCLYPMEKTRYDQENIPSVFVGHPLADEIELDTDRRTARQDLGLQTNAIKWIALLPGSRRSEIQNLARIFIATAQKYLQKQPNTHFLLSAINQQYADAMQNLVDKHAIPKDRLTIIVGKSRTLMAAADGVLLASGTATLECMLIKRPMVVAYKVSFITYQLVTKFLIRLPYISQPNILLNKKVVEEYLQRDVNSTNLAKALHRILGTPFTLKDDYIKVHRTLRCDASQNAIDAIYKLLLDRSHTTGT